MWKLNWRAAFASRLPGQQPALRGLLLAGLLAFVLALSGCSRSDPATGPLVDLGIVSPPTATPTPTPMPTKTATPTPTPTATPTALPARPAAQLPAGQLFFSVARQGEASHSLWWLPGGGALTLVADAVAPNAWDCRGGAAPRCVVVTMSGAVLALAPDGSDQALLDEMAWGLTPAAADQSSAAEMNPALAPAQPLSATLPLSTTSAVGAAIVVSATWSMSDTAPIPIAQIAPNGIYVAVAAPDRVQFFDLIENQLVATALLTDTVCLAWSFDSAALALVTQDPSGQTLALWQTASEQLRNLASVTQIGQIAWSAQSGKLAFDAQHGRGLRDVFFFDPATGEVRSLSEFALRDPKRAASGQIAAWRPEWEDDEKALRYVRGNPADPQMQSVVRHPLDSWQSTMLWPVAEEGLVGLLPTSDGQFQARLIDRDGQQVVQLRPVAGSDWQDGAASTFEDVQDLAWDPPAADGSHRYLLATRPQTVLWIDTWTGQDGDVAVACEQCRIERVIWRP